MMVKFIVVVCLFQMFAVVEESMQVSSSVFFEADCAQFMLTTRQKDELLNQTANLSACLYKFQQQLECVDQAFCPLLWISLNFCN